MASLASSGDLNRRVRITIAAAAAAASRAARCESLCEQGQAMCGQRLTCSLGSNASLAPNLA
jgi:hypothetical protein